MAVEILLFVNFDSNNILISVSWVIVEIFEAF